MSKRLWLVGKIKNDIEYKNWEFEGVFDSEKKALSICASINHFVTEVIVNKDESKMSQDFVGYYPLRERKNGDIN